MLIFDKEYFTVAQPSSASTIPLCLPLRWSHLWARHDCPMDQSNATHSGKVWKNIQPKKESREYSWTTKPGLEQSGTGSPQAQSNDKRHQDAWGCECRDAGSQLTHGTSGSTGPDCCTGALPTSNMREDHPQLNHSLQHPCICRKFPVRVDSSQCFLGDEVWLDHGRRCRLPNKIKPCPCFHHTSVGRAQPHFFQTRRSGWSADTTLPLPARGESWQGGRNSQQPHTDNPSVHLQGWCEDQRTIFGHVGHTRLPSWFSALLPHHFPIVLGSTSNLATVLLLTSVAYWETIHANSEHHLNPSIHTCNPTTRYLTG